MNNFTIIFFAFLFFRLNSIPVARDTLMESTLARQFNRRSIDDQICRDFVAICCKKDKPSENRVDIYESCLVDGFTHYCGANIIFSIHDFDVDMDTNFFENSGMDLDMDPAWIFFTDIYRWDFCVFEKKHIPSADVSYSVPKLPFITSI